MDAAPRCPFCDAPWTARMIELLDRATGEGCACCGAADHRPAPAPKAAPIEPLEEIRCDACGRALYTLPAAIHDH